MLTEAQVAKARTFPGCGDITAENAVDRLFAAADGLQNVAKDATDKNVAAQTKVTSLETELATAKAAIPQSTPPAVLKAMATAARVHHEAAIKAQAITPATGQALCSAFIGTDDKLSAIGLTPDATGNCVAVTVFSALASNGKAPNIDAEQPGNQPAPKTIAGAPDDKPLTPERLQALMSATPLGASALAAAK
jgi:hypothetical protein